jgi:iron complex transport system ATP-binding protein
MSVVTLEALSIGYRLGRRGSRTIASDLNVSLPAGEFTVLLGPNGAGKSTLIRTLSGLQAPLAGRVRLDGDVVHELGSRARAKRLAVVLTQQVKPWGLTARALVALGRHPHTALSGALSAEDHRIVDHALDATGSTALADRQLAELSDGERQRVMVARALAQQPRAMILDEVTAFLDLPHRVDIMLMLRRLAHASGAAMLLSTHDLDLALRTADRIWLLSPGGRFAVGTPESLVLSGAFDDVFQHDDVAFDRNTGSFALRQQGAGRAIVLGDGHLALWTRRALERLGYEVVRDSGEVTIEVLPAPTPQWSVKRGNLSARVSSLEALEREIRRG